MSLYDSLKNSENKSNDFPKKFSELTISQNFLSNCTFELTPLCNFRCSFCYARLSADDLKCRDVHVMEFSEWKRYIDELSLINCINLNITGGECTLHPDFVNIYSYAYDKGLVISVFTNGSYITDEIIEVFRQKPPSRIFVTVYGDDPETYEKITGRGDCCNIVKSNIKSLVEIGFDVVIQGTFTENNIFDMEKIFDFAHSLGCEYRYTTQLQNYGHCTDEHLENVDNNNTIAKQYSRNIWCKKHGFDPNKEIVFPKRSVYPKKSDSNTAGIKCNAGRNSCFIRHDGIMTACNTFDAFEIDTHGKSVQECFEQLNKWASSVPRIKECNGCIHAIHCVTCVAAHYNDTKQLGVPSPRLCYKITHPEEAKKEREFFDKHGYIEI